MKILVVYYSYSGITKRLAEDIALITNGDLIEIKIDKPYSFSYNTAVKEVREQIEKQYCPKIISDLENVNDYDTIFIGSPNWLKTFAPPILSFLKEVDLSNKTIIPFCTHGGGGFGRILDDYKKECKNSIIKNGIALKGNYNFEELKSSIQNIL